MKRYILSIVLLLTFILGLYLISGLGPKNEVIAFPVDRINTVFGMIICLISFIILTLYNLTLIKKIN